MIDPLRERRHRPAILISIATLLALLPSTLSAGSAPRRAASITNVREARPALAPVSLHALANTVGGQVSWVEKNKKLRLKNAWHDMVFEADRREITVDGLRVFLGEAPTFAERTLVVSPIDRDRVLLPLLSPTQFGPRPPIRTIVLDPGTAARTRARATRGSSSSKRISRSTSSSA